MPIGAFDEDAAVSRKTRRMGLRNCTPVPFVPFHSQIGRKRYESRKMDTCGDCTGVAIDLGHGVFPHPPGILLRGAWLGGDLA